MLKGLIVFSFPKKLFLSWKSKTWNQQCPQLSSITAIRFPITSALTCQGLPNSCLLSHPGLRAGAFLTKMRCTPRFAYGISRVRTHTHTQFWGTGDMILLLNIYTIITAANYWKKEMLYSIPNPYVVGVILIVLAVSKVIFRSKNRRRSSSPAT